VDASDARAGEASADARALPTIPPPPPPTYGPPTPPTPRFPGSDVVLGDAPTGPPDLPTLPELEGEHLVVRRATRADHRYGRRAWLFPERQRGHRFSLGVLPYVGEGVVGSLFDTRWRYQGRGGIWTLLRVGPVGVARADGDRVGTLDATAMIGWEHSRFFAFGVGVGGAYARVDDGTRRARGLTPTVQLRLRAGSLDGAFWMLEVGWIPIGGEPWGAGFRHHLRFPIGTRFLDLEVGASPALAWIYLSVGVEMNLPGDDRPNPRWRWRPHAGISEIIDPVTRDGGGGLSIGLTLIYRERGVAQREQRGVQRPASR